MNWLKKLSKNVTFADKPKLCKGQVCVISCNLMFPVACEQGEWRPEGGAAWPVGVGSTSWPGLSSSSPSSVASPADQGTRRCLAMNSLVVRTVFSAIPYFERSIHETEAYVIGAKNYNL